MINLFISTNSLAEYERANLKLRKSKCTNVDIRSKMSPELSYHFSKPQNQMQVGWCYGFSAADLISAEVGTPVSSTHVSALFNKSIDQNVFMNNAYKFARKFIKGKFKNVYEGGFVRWAVNASVKDGSLCSEKDFPYDEKFYGETEELIKFLEDLKQGLAHKTKVRSCGEAQFVIDNFRLDIGTNELLSFLANDTLNKNFSEIISSQCENKKIPLPDLKVRVRTKPQLNSQHSVNQFYSKIDEVLKSGKPLGLEYHSGQVTKTRGGLHASVITARKWENGKCQFKVRNSWGTGCSAYDFNEVESCNPQEGSYWVEDKKFLKLAHKIIYVK